MLDPVAARDRLSTHGRALSELRWALHREPDVSGEERGTAERIARFLGRLEPDELVTQLGGHGVACVFAGAEPGPTVLFRCELDALPIQEESEAEHRSERPGVAHSCGHDGHMAILAGLATLLAECRPASGRAVLLYQPAEETGAGARAVVADPAFARLAPDWAFAVHNVPGFAAGTALIRAGSFCCASRGLVVRLRGSPAHAAHPGDGVSPAAAMCRLLAQLPELPQRSASDVFGLVTVVHARLGSVAFGTSPGDAEVMATLRSETDAGLAELSRQAVEVATAAAVDDGLELDIAWRDEFAACVNHADAARIVVTAADAAGVPVAELGSAFRWSEDFGVFCSDARGALIGLGAGEDRAPLHAERYDFPDQLIEPGVLLLAEIARQLLTPTPAAR